MSAKSRAIAMTCTMATMANTTADLMGKMEAFLQKIDGPPAELPNSSAEDEQELFKSNDEAPPKKSKILEKLQQSSRDQLQSSAGSTQELPKSNHRHQQGLPKKSRAKWTDDDYRLRGYATPAERAADPRKRLTLDVRPATQAALHKLAIELGVTLGEALDSILGGA